MVKMALSCSKKMSALLRGVTLKHDGDFYCLNCFYSYSTEKKLQKHYSASKNHDHCYVEMPKEDSKISKCNHGKKSVKDPFNIYPDVESLLEKMSTCRNNPEKSSTTEIKKYIPSGYSFFTHCSFHSTKNKLDCYRRKECMERFCKDLKENNQLWKKEMIPLTDEKNQSYKMQKVC